MTATESRLWIDHAKVWVYDENLKRMQTRFQAHNQLDYEDAEQFRNFIDARNRTWRTEGIALGVL